MDSATLYDEDVVAWAEEQVAALRALAAKSPELSNTVDWANIIEEIESVGRSEWRAIESNLTQALAHILKGFCDPDSLSRLSWSVETGNFLQEIRKDFRNSMRRRIELDEVWRAAFKIAARELSAYRIAIPPGIPVSCPFALDDVLDETFAYDVAVHHLHSLIEARH